MVPRGSTVLIYECVAPLNRSVTTQVLARRDADRAGVGFLSGAFGKGGSAIATPLLHLLGVPAMVAIASPLPATIPSSWLASRVVRARGQRRPPGRARRSPDRAPDDRRRRAAHAVDSGRTTRARHRRRDPRVRVAHPAVATRAGRRRTRRAGRVRHARRPRAWSSSSVSSDSCRACSATAAASCSRRCSSRCSACRFTARSARRSCSPRAWPCPARSCTRGSATSTGRSRSRSVSPQFPLPLLGAQLALRTKARSLTLAYGVGLVDARRRPLGGLALKAVCRRATLRTIAQELDARRNLAPALDTRRANAENNPNVPRAHA